MFLDNNIKRYEVGGHEKSVEGNRGKAEIKDYVILQRSKLLKLHLFEKT